MDIQSINKSIYKCPKTPWSKVLIQSKTHVVLLSCLFNAKSIFLHISHVADSLFFTFTVIVNWGRYMSDTGRRIVYLWCWQSMKMSRLSSLLQELSNQFPCGLCFFLRQSFQNGSNFLSNLPYMRGFTECEPTTLRTLARYVIQTYFSRKWFSPAMYKIYCTEAGIFPIP
jgi:hypothetical protein